jgi:hypothetical protein
VYGDIIMNALAAYLLVPVLAAGLPFFGEAESRNIAKGESWKHAAMNFANAAVLQETQAESLLQYAADNRKKEYMYDDDRKGNHRAAAEQERKAGDLYAMASINYERAADSYRKAASEYKKAASRERESEMTASAKASVDAVFSRARQAAAAYELAADGFIVSNQLELAAAASEKAALQRVKVAGAN